MLNNFLKVCSLLFIFQTGHADELYFKDPLELDKFQFPEPKEADLGTKFTLWATYYYLPELQDQSGTVPLRNKLGDELGPKFTRKEWCTVAMEGSVRVLGPNQEARTYNYSGSTPDYPVNCKDIFKHDVSKSKFNIAVGPYGDGLPDTYILAPYRTLATDLNYIKPGTILYIPKARGARIKLSNGRVIFHDGYFFAGDKGGAIKGNHVDVFIGVDKSAIYFPWIGSSSSKTFEAIVVKDQKIIDELTELHAQ